MKAREYVSVVPILSSLRCVSVKLEDWCLEPGHQPVIFPRDREFVMCQAGPVFHVADKPNSLTP
jgi:hypothetical protein